MNGRLANSGSVARHRRAPLGLVRSGAVMAVVAGLSAAATISASPQAVAAPVEVPASDGDRPDPGPVRDEPFEVRGSEAVELLDGLDATEAVADNADMSPVELVDELDDDPTMFVTSDGMVGYAEPAPLDEAVPAEAPLLDAALVPSDVFALDSKPSSGLTVYLDFTGHTTVDDYWNSTYGIPVIVSAPYDLDGDPNSFSPAERANIYEIWQRVAEDYVPFDVNVTTRDPGVDGLRKVSATDTVYGQRMVITSTNWYRSGVLGIALLSVFDADFDHSAFVFASEVLGPSGKGVGETASHEAGHTFGLKHDGVGSSEYYDGHGDWAPIMGRPLTRTVTQWSRGEYLNATNTEDDINEIACYVGYGADDHGATEGIATVVTHTSTTTGVIGVGGDTDSFVVKVGAGNLSVTVRPLATWANLHARVTVRNSVGTVVGTAVPGVAVSWSSVVDSAVPPGTYTISVESTSWLDPSTGFSTYGSLGAYALDVVGANPGAGAGPVTTPAGDDVVTPSCTSRFTAVTPARLMDTRRGLGGSIRVGARREVVLQVAGNGGIPSDARAAVLNVVAVNPSGPGYLTTYPCSRERPTTSTVNYATGQNVANNTIAALSASGQLCIWAYDETDVIVDVTGWLGSAGDSKFTPVGPVRVTDTRSGFGGSRLAAGETLEVNFFGVVPVDATAVALNVTAAGASSAAYLTVYPCGQALPPTSTVNYVADEDRPNNTIVGLGNRKVCIYSYAATDVLVDLVGYLGPTGLSYKPTAPVRVLDTRRGAPVPAGVSVAYNTNAPALETDVAEAAFVNVTAVDHLVAGYVTTFDCVVRRETSTVNQQVGQVSANGAIVPLQPNGDTCAWMYGGGHLVVDLNGWWVH